MDKTKTVYLAILNQGWIRAELAILITRWLQNSSYNIYLHFPAEKPIEHNRNNIVKRFLETDFDYLMMLDCDIIPPTDIFNLVDFDKDIIGGLCFACKSRQGREILIPLILKRKKEDKRDDVEWKYSVIEVEGNEGLMECDAVGTGCIIIARRVLEHPKMKPAFVNYYDKDGLRIEGLDLSFCRRTQELGFKIYCHLDYPCSHWCDMDLMKIYREEVKKNQKVGQK